MSLFTEESLDNLRKKVKLDEVCEALGIDGVNGYYNCPFCGGETFVLNCCDEPTLYYCFDCESKGDAISLIMESRDQSFKNAVRFLSIMYDIDMELVDNK